MFDINYYRLILLINNYELNYEYLYIYKVIGIYNILERL